MINMLTVITQSWNYINLLKRFTWLSCLCDFAEVSSVTDTDLCQAVPPCTAACEAGSNALQTEECASCHWPAFVHSLYLPLSLQ